jgi:hypothetical protein
MAEYEALQAEIEALKAEVSEERPPDVHLDSPGVGSG